MEKSALLTPTLPPDLKDWPFSRVANTPLEPYWWELQPTTPITDKAEEEKLLAEFEQHFGFRPKLAEE